MHGLLAPAINLMNRLSYAQKFGVISLTFFVPLLFLSYAIINETYQEKKRTDSAQQSLQLINEVLTTKDLASQYRDLASAEIFFPRPELTEQVEKLQSDLAAQFKKMVSNEKYTQIISGLDQKTSDWMKGLARSGDNKQPTIQDQYKAYHQVVKDIVFLARRIAQSSGIAQDTDERVQILLKLMLTDYPAYKETLGLAHAVGVYAIIEQYIGTMTYNTLNDTYDALDISFNAMQQNHASLIEKDFYNRQFSESFKQVEENAQAIKFKLDEELIAAVSVETTWQDYSDFFNEKITVVGSVRGIALTNINRILDGRVDNLIQKLLVVAISIGAVMLVIIYLYAAFFWSVRSTVGEFHGAAKKISRGDMRIRVSIHSNDEMGDLTTEFNAMVEKIHELLKAVHKTAMEVGDAMKHVGNNAEKSSHAANEQLQQTEQVASAITEMSATAEEVNRQSSEASGSANRASEQANDANIVVGETLSQINKLADEMMRSTEVINTLAENSDNIANMLSVIKGIAEQTNLLALNAAIEAARAGEQGRGFAVVADEVRTLASRTQASAQEIENVMTTIRDGIGNAVEVMDNSQKMAQDTVQASGKVRDALNSIVEMIQAISAANNQIAVSADEQTKVARTIDQNVVTINDLGKATVDDAAETVEAIKEVVALTESLLENLQRFQV
ncbi:methyl-accepting chemotaxis protein [Bermanella sp. R86510]|uniref:methyl-accepting chemotaxis protein n=1 Tax=unclassified Bermanella TaxID=2627862 RepID=UPI0037CAEE4B